MVDHKPGQWTEIYTAPAIYWRLISRTVGTSLPILLCSFGLQLKNYKNQMSIRTAKKLRMAKERGNELSPTNNCRPMTKSTKQTKRLHSMYPYATSFRKN